MPNFSLSADQRETAKQLLLNGKSYREIEELTGADPKKLYGIAFKLRNAGHQLSPTKPSRRNQIYNTAPVGKVGPILQNLPEEIYLQIRRQPGDTWAVMLENYIKKVSKNASPS